MKYEITFIHNFSISLSIVNENRKQPQFRYTFQMCGGWQKKMCGKNVSCVTSIDNKSLDISN